MSDQQSVLVAAAPVAFGSAQASRSPGAIEVQVARFDNTRTAGRVSFTFYDNGGNPISPGAIAADATTAFAQYFSSSSLGGNFNRGVFPVTGDTARDHLFPGGVHQRRGKRDYRATVLQ